jgi:hypothetical protein
MQGDIPVGTRVRIANRIGDDGFGTVAEPDPYFDEFSRGRLFILRDGSDRATHTFFRDRVEIVEEPSKDIYNVLCGLSADPVKVFNDLEKAREFRDGFNAALAKVYASSNHINFKAKIVQEVEETKIVKVKKEIQ